MSEYCECSCKDIIIEMTPEGADGVGIANIELISTSGVQKTYRINFTNGTYFDYIVMDGSNIASITKTGTDLLTDTYTVTLTNGDTTTFQVTNGRGIVSITKTGTAGLVDSYRVLFNDGTYYDYNVTNGQPCTHEWNGTVLTITSASGTSSSDLKGDKGDTATIAVGTVTTLPAGSSATVENVGTVNDGIFDFGIPKGDKGEKGDVMYATFEIDTDTGILSMFTDEAYDGPDFEINSVGHLEVVI